MANPNFSEEKKLWKRGFKGVAGLDEAGRGPLAGPVVAAAVSVPKNFKLQIKNSKLVLKDSKKLSANQREEFYKIITKNKNIKWGIGIIPEKVIDRINILEATKLAMVKAINNLTLRHGSGRVIKPDYLILDGNMKLDLPAGRQGLNMPQKSIVKGDEKVFSCAAASIIAKVTRDRIMQKMHKKYPQYGFNIHKGYPTKKHLVMLTRYGLCEIHRRSFRPVSKIQKLKCSIRAQK